MDGGDGGGLSLLRHVSRDERVDGRERDAFAGAEGDARDEEWRDARGGGFWGDEGGERPREHAEEQDGFSADAIRESSPEELGERVAVEERGQDAALADLIPAELMRHGDDGGADVGAVGVAHKDGGGGEENENAPVAGAVAGDAVAGSRGPDGARVEGGPGEAGVLGIGGVGARSEGRGRGRRARARSGDSVRRGNVAVRNGAEKDAGTLARRAETPRDARSRNFPRCERETQGQSRTRVDADACIAGGATMGSSVRTRIK